MLYQLLYLHFLSPKCLQAIESKTFHIARFLKEPSMFLIEPPTELEFHSLDEKCVLRGGESCAVSFSTWKQLRPWTWNCAPQKLEPEPELQLNLDLYAIIIFSKSLSTYWFRHKCALIGENELMRVPAHEFIFDGIGKFIACTIAHNLFLSLLVYPRRRYTQHPLAVHSFRYRLRIYRAKTYFIFSKYGAFNNSSKCRRIG